MFRIVIIEDNQLVKTTGSVHTVDASANRTETLSVDHQRALRTVTVVTVQHEHPQPIVVLQISTSGDYLSLPVDLNTFDRP